MKGLRWKGLGLMLLCAAALVMGCGSGSDSDTGTSAATSDSSTSATATADAGSLQEQAKQKVAEFTAAPTDFPGPTEAFDPGSGKAVVVACGFAAPVCVDQAKDAVEALKAMGWSAPSPLDGKQSPQTQGALLARATQDKVDAVIFVGNDLTGLAGQVDRAAKAGVVIACTLCANDQLYSQHPDWEGKVFDVTIQWQRQGEMNGWAALARHGTDTKVFAAVDKNYYSNVLRQGGVQKVLEQNCPECKFEILNVSSDSVTKPGPPEFLSLLSTHPAGAITDMIGQYDAWGVKAAQTAKQQGRDDLSVAGYDASADGIAAIERGDTPFTNSVGEAFTYSEWAAADLIGRAKAGKPFWDGYGDLPVVLVDKSNVETYKNGKGPVPPGDWKTDRFKKYWSQG